MSTEKSFFSSIKNALTKTKSKISDSISGIFKKNKLDDVTLNELEESLLLIDLGFEYTQKVVNSLKNSEQQEIKANLISYMSKTLKCAEKDIEIQKKPHVIIMCGVNGNGKTTTSAKLANYYKNNNLSVMLSACDTFRAGAVEQLKEWSKLIDCSIFFDIEKSDPASVAYKSFIKAKEQNIDVLIIDTAGRLDNYSNLMDELKKITKVVKKIDESAPHNTILVIDATIGKSANNQVERFKESCLIDGLIVTKIDGSSKCGALIQVVDKYKLPVFFVGVGEKMSDLVKFNSDDFINAIFE